MAEVVFTLTQLRTDPGAVASALETGRQVSIARRGEVAAHMELLLDPVRPSGVLRERAAEVVRLAVDHGLTAGVRVAGAILDGVDHPGDPIELLVAADRETESGKWPAAFVSLPAELLDLDVRVTWIGSPAAESERLLDQSEPLLGWAGVSGGEPAEIS